MASNTCSNYWELVKDSWWSSQKSELWVNAWHHIHAPNSPKLQGGLLCSNCADNHNNGWAESVWGGTYGVERGCGNHTGGRRLVVWGESVESGLEELRGAGAHHNVTALGHRIAHQLVQRPDLVVKLMLHKPHMLVLCEVAHALPPGDDDAAARPVLEPVLLEHGGVATTVKEKRKSMHQRRWVVVQTTLENWLLDHWSF